MRKIYNVSIILMLSVAIISCGGGEKKKKGPVSTGDNLVDQLTQQISDAPDNPEILYQRATVLYEKGEYEAAIRDLEKAMSIDSLKPKYYHLLSDNYMDYFKSRKALDVMEKASRLFNERIPTLLKLSETQMLLSQHENSVFTVNEILRLDPQNNEAYFMLGMNFRAMGQLDKAINSFQTAVENDPEMVDAWLILGELHEKNGTGDPMKYYENALTVSPDNPQVMHSMAFHLQNNGDIPGAIKIYKEISSKNRQYTDAYLNAGILYIEQDSLEQAFEQMNILAGVQPENPFAYYYRGVIHKAYGNYESAEIDLQNAVNLQPLFTQAKEELAIVQDLIAINKQG
ncbi:MAG: tetratricopeptide (TPR) repeat protein [Saprospiraceae bacterium]|jgi:tetratricopeptide (TPR) repeat protein